MNAQVTLIADAKGLDALAKFLGTLEEDQPQTNLSAEGHSWQ